MSRHDVAQLVRSAAQPCVVILKRHVLVNTRGDQAAHDEAGDIVRARSGSKRRLSGWLMKKGRGGRRNWKRRWFRLDRDRNVLSYYSAQGGELRGVILLSHAKIVGGHMSDTFSVIIQDHGDQEQNLDPVYELRAPDTAQRMQWLASLHEAAASLALPDAL